MESRERILPNAVLEHGVAKGWPRVSLTGPWDSAVGEYMRQDQVASLCVNFAHGFVGKDLAFLREVPHLRCLFVLDPWIKDVSPIYDLPALEELDFGTVLPHRIDFTKFPVLRSARFQWRNGCESIFAASGLENLNVTSYPGTDLEPFAALSRLESLEFLRGKLIGLDGVSAMPALRYLRLGLIPSLSSLVGAEEVGLQDLSVELCKRVDDIAPLATATTIRRLAIANCGDISSLGPIETMASLEHLNACESTKIVDGDLKPLLRAPKLRSWQLAWRKHYRPSRAEMEREQDLRHARWLRAQGKPLSESLSRLLEPTS